MISQRKNVLHLIDGYYSLSESEITKRLFELFKSNIKIVFQEVLPEFLTQLKIVNNKVLVYNSKNQLAIEIKSILESIKAEQDEIDLLRKLNALRDKVLITGAVFVSKVIFIRQNKLRLKTQLNMSKISLVILMK